MRSLLLFSSLIVLFVCGCKSDQTKYREYLEYFDNPKNKLIATTTYNGISYESHYRSPLYNALVEMRTLNPNKLLLENKISDFTRGTGFLIKVKGYSFSSNNNLLDTLQSSISLDLENNFYSNLILVHGLDTLKNPVVHVFSNGTNDKELQALVSFPFNDTSNVNKSLELVSSFNNEIANIKLIKLSPEVLNEISRL